MPDLKQIIFNLPYSVIVVNEQRCVVLSNRMAQKVSGLSEKSMINKRGGDVLGCVHAKEHEKGCGFSTHCRWCEAKSAVVTCFEKQADIEPFEMKLHTRLAGIRDLKLTVTYLPADEPLGKDVPADLAILTVDDLTDYKAKEKAAAALETIGAICHEFNQPLTVGLGQLSLLKLEIGENRRVESLSKEFQKMGELTTKLMRLNSYQTRNYTDGSTILDIHKSANWSGIIMKEGEVEAVIDVSPALEGHIHKKSY